MNLKNTLSISKSPQYNEISKLKEWEQTHHASINQKKAGID